jgi:CheY-like chemotaxis protein
MAEELVLVVDDELPIAALLTHLVRSYGLRAEAAHDGKQALEMIRTHKPDLVLLDLIMPVMNGSSLLAIMESDPDLRDVSVIVISTSTEPIRGVKREVPRLRKPFEPTEVKRLVLKTLGGDGNDN